MHWRKSPSFLTLIICSDFKNGWIPRYLNRVLRKCDGADGANAASGEPKTCFGDANFEVAKTCMKVGDSPDLPSRDKVSLAMPPVAINADE